MKHKENTNKYKCIVNFQREARTCFEGVSKSSNAFSEDDGCNGMLILAYSAAPSSYLFNKTKIRTLSKVSSGE